MNEPTNGEIIIYKSDSGNIKVNVLFEGETIWLSQKQMGELFDTSKQNISLHLQNCFDSGELSDKTTVKNFLTVQNEGNRSIKRDTKLYNLDAIIAVGYRVNSLKATQFRIWATKVLKEFIIKGFVMDDERLKNGKHFGKDYFKELLERVRSIRTSERRIYLQITDIFAECSIDYDQNSQVTKNFYANIQNKFHFAITKQTAAEIVYNRANKEEANMGLQTWKNSPEGRILKSDTIIAKNYLTETEIKKLERTISSYFDYIENQLEQQNSFTMENLSHSVALFLEFNNFKVLEGNGNISHKQAEEKAFSEYDEFNKTQKIYSDFEKFAKGLNE